MADPLPYQEIVTYGGMLIGAAVAAALVRLGLKKPAVPDSTFAISGQASITDMGPVKELLGQLDQLTLQLTKAAVSVDAQNAQLGRTAVALEQLADLLANYLAAQTERLEEAEREADVARRVEERLKELGVKPPARRQN